jgi:anti-anti-sigma factor
LFMSCAQEAAAAEGRPRVQFIVLDLSPVQHIDASAVRDFFDFAREMADLGVCLVAANPSPHVAAIFERSGLQAALGDLPLML